MVEVPSPTESALDAAFAPQRTRYVVGIDLGTTNCAMAFVDTHRSPSVVETVSVEQLIDFGVTARSETLPSFHYELTQNEMEGVEKRFQFFSADSSTRHVGIVGTLARERALQVPGRGIASAKSWLCHGLVDRDSELLPWHGEEDVERLSPVEASSRYLEHWKRQWDQRFPEYPLEQQEVVVTLPASFDEVARNLTLKAAKRAGLENVILIEEPQAAFYAWLNRHHRDWMQVLSPGQTILVCDIGGGTTDFTLIRVIDSAIASEEPEASPESSAEWDQSRQVENKLQSVFGLHRVAVGPHLMLGGDNLDLALAHYVEQQLVTAAGGEPLSPRQWDMLKAHARKAKESLLGNSPPDRYAVSLSGSGAKLIAKTRTVTIERDWARKLLIDGFFGQVEIDAVPQPTESLFQEFGLPYESEPSVHKHLAHFLWQHRWAGRQESDRGRFTELQAARPDWILFNGGVLESAEISQTIVDQVAHWFAPASSIDWRPGLLEGNRLDLAVAHGAAYFGLVRRGEGIRIDARLARAYYLLVQRDPDRAVCIMPASAMPLDRYRLDAYPFDLTVGEPVQFPLYYSSSHLTHDFGEWVDVDPKSMTAMPPIQTVLEWGRSRRRGTIPVVMESALSEIGTLHMSIVTRPEWEEGEGRWSLEFDVRGGTASDLGTPKESAWAQTVDSDQIARGLSVLQSVFGTASTQPPKDIYAALSSSLECSRRDWPPSLLRSMWKYLYENPECRKRSPETEARWLNLLGWCLRPGFGFPADDWRVQCTWKSVHNKLMHRSAANVSESVVLWRRIAGGFTAGQQQALFQDAWIRIKPTLVSGPGASHILNTNVASELLRLLGSLERLKHSDKGTLVESGLGALAKKKLTPLRPAIFWMLGRLACRIPVYASLQQTVPVERVAAWVERMLVIDRSIIDDSLPAYTLALMQMTRKTGDRYRDIPDSLRKRVLETMEGCHAPETHRRLVAEAGLLDEENAASIMGDSLPLGFSLRATGMGGSIQRTGGAP